MQTQWRAGILVAIVGLGLSAIAPATQGQIPVVPPPDLTPTGDSTRVGDPFRVDPPIPPLGALWRSMLLPGWGQSVLHRRSTGAFFVMFEGIAVTMTLKSIHQLSYLKSVLTEGDDEALERVESKRQEIQDWAVLWGFNHLLAGVEALVSAYLWDFPEELELRAFSVGEGGWGLGVTVPIP